MIDIDGTTIGPDERPYIIAEVGINAQNNIELAKAHIRAAADAGADAVKFQTHMTDAEMVESEMRAIGAGEVYDTLVECEWTVDEHRELQSCARSHGLTFLSTPFSVEAVDILRTIDVPAIKIGSGEMNNYYLLECATKTERPLLVSTGMNSLEEIADTIEFLDDVATSYALFYCVSEYPTSAEDFDFQTITMLEDMSGAPVGFSDHSTGVEAAKVAIGNGATLVEKHFTIDRRLPGPDQEVSIESEELADLCSFADLYHETAGTKTNLEDEEEEIKRWAQHSIVTTEKIKEGDNIGRQNITTKRPGNGISAKRYFDILGRRVTTTLEANTVIKQHQLDE